MFVKGNSIKYFESSSVILLLVLSTIAVGFIIGESNIAVALGPNIPSTTVSPTTASGGLLGSTETGLVSTPNQYAFSGKTAADTGASGGGEGIGSIFTGTIASIYDGSIVGGGLGAVVSGAAWAGTVYAVIALVAPMLGADKRTSDSLAISAFSGVLAGKLAYYFIGGGVKSGTILGMPAGQGAFVIGAGVAVAVFLLTYKKEEKKIVELQCLPYEPPLGGSDCEKCNADPLHPCSEYRCRSLGQACELVNPGSTEERCVWVSRNDVKSPVMTPWKEMLTKGYAYSNLQGRPPSLGTKIVPQGANNGCIKPFTPLKFGITLNEPAQCKLDFEGNKSFKDMQFYFGESNLFRYNHTEQLNLPSPDALKTEAPEIPNEGTYNMYVRCQDKNGNVNEDEFVFNFCVDKSPDTTAPVIVDTSIQSGSPVSFGVQNTSFSAYINEPAECKWSFQDKDYSLMENALTCSTHVYEQNAQQLYPCTTVLTGIQDRTDNTFYFRCKDQPLKADNERNVNSQSFKLTLKGTQTLTITSVGPNATFTGSTAVVPLDLTAETRNGAEEGKATCYFSPTGLEGTFVSMFETGGVTHKQKLALEAGNYTYVVRCVDAGGNADVKNTTFSVSIDRSAPQVTRVYKEQPDALKVITDENAECVYSLNSCNFVFEEGIAMKVLSPSSKTIHLSEWKPNLAYYIKCRDSYNNQPASSLCSIIASGSNII